MNDEERACMARLAEYLSENHANEVDHAHYGDGPFGCTYCEAISEAEGLLGIDDAKRRATAGE